MPRRSIKKPDERLDINISPMIDMVFILLIFFIVTTVFVEEQGIEAERPQPGPTTEDDNKPIKLHLSVNGQLFIEDKEIQSSSIRSLVADRIRGKMVPVIIEVEEGVPSGKMVLAIDESRLGGAEKVMVTPVQKNERR